jgi:hypothetical protein
VMIVMIVVSWISWVLTPSSWVQVSICKLINCAWSYFKKGSSKDCN